MRMEGVFMLAAQSSTKKRRLTRLERQEEIEGWLFISPIVLGLLLWTLIPVVASLGLSFMNYWIMKSPQWIGTHNYVRMFTRDEDFYQALKVTFSFVAMQLPAGLAIALFEAVLLNTGARGMAFFRTCFYLPAVVPAVALSLVWRWVLNLNYGVVNQGLRLVGIKGINFLGDPRTALPTMAVMSWFGVGQAMVIFLAGLLNIPPSLYEAAEIDGAGRVRTFFSITLPMLTPTIFYMIVMGLIGSFQYFTQAYILTSGGPLKSTYFYNLMIYNVAFKNLQMGYASALAWFLLLIILVLTLSVFRSSSAWVYYELEMRK